MGRKYTFWHRRSARTWFKIPVLQRRWQFFNNWLFVQPYGGYVSICLHAFIFMQPVLQHVCPALRRNRTTIPAIRSAMPLSGIVLRMIGIVGALSRIAMRLSRSIMPMSGIALWMIGIYMRIIRTYVPLTRTYIPLNGSAIRFIRTYMPMKRIAVRMIGIVFPIAGEVVGVNLTYDRLMAT
ncbi:hypothetical protein HNQ91_002825 [Filimonas zeae]|uniref:hypothetical protein n=1 Tax=Filimonas zeae TaxID=1737353 RepID=UPI001662C01B|nr:hypothetical protein [Filimonas zeae]MDR6339760.1 hypothetical protein [Filimonas zeae]